MTFGQTHLLELMEEVVAFLKDQGIACFLQEAEENSRYEPWTPGSILFNRRLSKIFSHTNLVKGDPPRWTSSEGKPLEFLGEMEIPEGFCTLLDWFFVVEPNFTDRRGWKHYLDAQGGLLYPTRGAEVPTAEHKFRRRRWQRVLVQASSEQSAQELVHEDLHACASAIRTLSPLLIDAALGGHCHEIQFIMEVERRPGTSKPFSHTELGAWDPPRWSSGPQENLTDDPAELPVKSLRQVLTSELNHTNGWTALHQFLFTVFPDKDEEGWEYNLDFSEEAAGDWSPTPSPNCFVRRRVWMRPCVRDKDLNVCRDRLRRYISAHPRGVVKEGRLQRQSHYRRRWCEGTAILTDTKLEISLENNYQGVVVYDLVGCEVISDFDAEDTTGHSFRFGLRTIDEVLQQTQEVRCILNARSRAEQLQWVTILSRQVAQANLAFWALPFGPPVHHEVLIQGNMWKQSTLAWRFRKFELQGDGVLSYWKDNTLRGKIKLNHCTVERVDNGYPFSFAIKKTNGYCLVLRTSDESTRAQWIAALQTHTSTSHSPQKAVLPAQGTRCRQKSLTDIPNLSALSISPNEKSGSEDDLNQINSTGQIYDNNGIGDDGEPKRVVGMENSACSSRGSGDHEDTSGANLATAVDSTSSADVQVPAGAAPVPVPVPAPSPPAPPSAPAAPVSLPAVRRATLGPGVVVESGSTTHTVEISRLTGRRVSVLNDDFKEHLDHQTTGIWEASDDSDDSDGSAESRSSSFIDIHASRNRSAIASLFSAAKVNKHDEVDNEDEEDSEGGVKEDSHSGQWTGAVKEDSHSGQWRGAAWEEEEPPPPPEHSSGFAHRDMHDSKGRRMSVQNEALFDSADKNCGEWGGFDSDGESDGDDDGRPSSMAIPWTGPR